MNQFTWQTPFLVFATHLLINTATADQIPANIIAALHYNSTAPNATRVSASSLDTYSLVNEYNATNFFNEFEFFTGQDPTHGTVQYTDESVARQYNLIAVKNSSIPGQEAESNVYFAAHDGTFDHALSVSVSRPSIRLTSKQKYTKGLFIADIAHLPVAECGAWPAYWTTNLNGSWPAGGEIDIIEGVNTQQSNQITLHTGGQCSITSNPKSYRGSMDSTDCQVSSSPSGCFVTDNNTASYGDSFNAGHGGIYAMEWTSEAISVWWWARRDVPADVASGQPNPKSWAIPVAHFTECDIDALFQNHQIIFDITFCGDWAGQAAIWGPQCAAKYGSSCSAYVMDNSATADAFREAYWEIASVKVYQD